MASHLDLWISKRVKDLAACERLGLHVLRWRLSPYVAELYRDFLRSGQIDWDGMDRVLMLYGIPCVHRETGEPVRLYGAA
jgi:hypothetical protein